MRKFRFAMFLTVAVAVLSFTMPTAAQHQHRRTGDIWVGCVADAPATTWESAIFSALSIGDKENRSCWINRQRGWWVFRWTEKFPVVIFPSKKSSKGPTESSALFSTHQSC